MRFCAVPQQDQKQLRSCLNNPLRENIQPKESGSLRKTGVASSLIWTPMDYLRSIHDIIQQTQYRSTNQLLITPLWKLQNWRIQHKA